MSGRSTKRVTNSQEATLKKLEEEAKQFTQKSIGKPPVEMSKPLTPRQELAGYILAGLLSRSRGLVNQGDLIREAFDWADQVLQVK